MSVQLEKDEATSIPVIFYSQAIIICPFSSWAVILFLYDFFTLLTVIHPYIH